MKNTESKQTATGEEQSLEARVAVSVDDSDRYTAADFEAYKLQAEKYDHKRLAD